MSEFRLGIIAKDYERSISFYRDGLGLKITSSWDRGANDKGTLLEFGNGIIEIFPCSESLPPAKPVGVWLYIEVPNVDEYFKRISEKEIPVLLAPKDEPWGHRRCKIKDPDGIEIGLFSVLSS
jgi:predicted enzyme related to lactoylglutathione lyase